VVSLARQIPQIYDICHFCWQYAPDAYTFVGVTTPDANATRAKSFLVVDDEAEIREIQSDYLVSRGFEVIEADSVEAAISALEKKKFDVFVTDLRMPGRDGMALIIEIRRRFGAEPAIIVVTADMRRSLDSIYDAGADVVLPKPFNFSDFDRALQKCFLPERSKFKRTHARHRVYGTATIRLDSKDPQTFAVSNLSKGGAFFRGLPRDFTVGDAVEFSMALEGNPRLLWGRGIIRWLRKNSPDFDQPVGFGIEFLVIDEDSSLTIEELYRRS
jgi:CheY-like chemotaxis protein